MEIPAKEIIRLARESIVFNEQEFLIDDDGTRVTVSLADIFEFGGSAAAELKLQIKNGTEAGKYQITEGVVNGEDPTLGGAVIGGDPEADPVVDVPEFTVTATTYVWVKCVGVFGSPDSYTTSIETDTAGYGIGDPPAGTDISATGFTSFYYIGEVAFTAGSPATYEITNQHGGGNLGVDSWGLYNLWWRS